MHAQFPSLDSFFSPAAIAVIGASPEKNRIRGTLLHLLRKNRYPGRIYPVNPSYQEIDGLPCFPTVGAVGAAIDLALIAIPAERVLAALEDCAAAGVRHAVIISSGFAEEGGAQSALQAEIAALSRRTGMRVCGPNGEGFHNEVGRVSATFSPAVDVRPDALPITATTRRIGIVAQSGGIGFALYNRGRALGLAFSHIVSTGNEADLTAADFLDYLAGDAETQAILLFLESVRDPVAFRQAAARAAAAGKPVVVVKVGRSEAGLRAAASHTASMAGWDAAYRAAFAAHGMIEAADPDEAMAIIAVLVTAPLPRGDRAGIITVSGGAGAWMADTLQAAGLAVPPLSAATEAAIRNFIPSYGSTRNPVDITAQGARGGGTVRAIELLAEDDGIDLIVVVTSLANEAHVSIDPASLGVVIAARQKPVLVFSYTIASDFARRAMAGAGAVVLGNLAAVGAAAAALVRRARFTPAASDIALPAISLPEAGGALAEHAAKAFLAGNGIAVPPYRLIRDAASLAGAAAELGFPLAVKIQSPAILHKTEAGGVRLGVADLPALHAAFTAVCEAAARHAPGAPLDGVLLEPMAKPGVEMIIGVIRDATFGPVLMVGAGGIATELFRDVTYRLAPADEAAALAMLHELKSFPLLDGFRGRPRADIAALARLIAKLSVLAAASGETLREMELNPVIVHPEANGCTIADALVMLQAAGG